MRKRDGRSVVFVEGLGVDVPGRRLLSGVDLVLERGDSVAIMGPSGSGKTTLLNCIAGLVRPSDGVVEVAGESLSDVGERKASSVRLKHIGIVFQTGELLPELTVLENVALPALFSRRPDAYAVAEDLLSAVALDGMEDRDIASLSGGEKQRVAVARALVCQPALVLADEPTGALDQRTAASIAELLVSACRAHGAALVVATHDPSVAAAATRTVELVDGRLRSGSAITSARA